MRLPYETRPIKNVKHLLVSDKTTVIVVRADKPSMTVVSHNKEYLKAVSTVVKNGTLEVKSAISGQQDVVVQGNNNVVFGGGGGTTVVTGDNNIVAGKDVYQNCKKLTNDKGSIGSSCSSKRDNAIMMDESYVVISLPEIPTIFNNSASDVIVHDIQQEALTVVIGGVGDVQMTGELDELKVVSMDDGNLNAKLLFSKHVTIAQEGYGTIRARALDSSDVTIKSSGDVVIYGDPKEKRQLISNNGNISFKGNPPYNSEPAP